MQTDKTERSNTEIFTNWMEEMYATRTDKINFICGDFNVDLLDPDKRKITDELINTVYSMSLFPLITRPTRITSHCATLIDNIFMNYMLNKTISGLVVMDVSDQLMFFAAYNYNH